MLLPHLLPLAVLAGSAAAKPFTRALLHKRQFTNSSIFGITQTDTVPSHTVETAPSCTATYTPNHIEDCGDIATMHRIHLHQHEANFLSTSKKCGDLLRGYGICFEETPNNDTNDERTSDSTTQTTSAIEALPTPASLVAGTTINGTTANITVISNLNDAIVAKFESVREKIVTRLETTTLSYTLGTADPTSVRTLVVTRTITEVVTFTTTLTNDISPPVSNFLKVTSTAESMLVTSPIPGTTCSSVSPPPAAVTNAVAAGCTNWYMAIPGDYCYKIAVQFGIPVEIFMGWNPTINAPWCTNLLAGSAYCVAICEDSGSENASPEETQLPPPSVPIVASPTLPSLPSPILPAGVTSLPPSPTLPAGVTSLPSSPTLPAGVTDVPGTSSMTSIPVPDSPTASQPAPAPSATSGTDVYRSYLGDGSVAAGWPSEQQWIDFEYMFEQNRPNMKTACAQWGVPDDSDQEINDLKSAILSVSSSSTIDARFILAIIMQESTGCVRVITTAWSHANPGLMQSHNGTGTCNTNMAPLGLPGVPGGGIVQTPCPTQEIHQMVADGTEGTVWGDGLVQLLKQQGDPGVQGYYRVARMYNGGSIDPSGALERGCCTASYASDVANRLTGWVKAARNFGG